MAKYEINHICGHVETVQIYGTNVHGERERRAAWLASKPCPECERRAKAEAARAKADEMGLPELTGSAKQVAWAEDIRAKAVRDAEDALGFDQSRALVASGTLTAEQAARMPLLEQALREGASEHADAAWWIDNRFNACPLVIKAVKARIDELFAEED